MKYRGYKTLEIVLDQAYDRTVADNANNEQNISAIDKTLENDTSSKIVTWEPFLLDQVKFLRLELENKQKVIEELFLLLSRDSDTANPEVHKTLLQDDKNAKYAKNVSVSTQTCDVIDETIEIPLNMNKSIIAFH